MHHHSTKMPSHDFVPYAKNFYHPVNAIIPVCYNCSVPCPSIKDSSFQKQRGNSGADAMENVTMFGKGPKTEVTASLVIKDFVEVMKSTEPGKFLESDDFMVKETPMGLGVSPNGYGESDRGGVGVYVANTGEVDVKVKVQFDSDTKSMNMKETTVKAEDIISDMWGFGRFLSHEEAKEHYKDKDFVVTAKVEVEGEVVKIVGDKEKSRKRKSMGQEVSEKIYRDMAWTDFTLEFEGEELAVHRVILAGASPVLAAMVRNQHIEAKEGKAVIPAAAAVGRAFVR